MSILMHKCPYRTTSYAQNLVSSMHVIWKVTKWFSTMNCLHITTNIHFYNQWVGLLSLGLTFLTEVVQHLSETYQLALKLAFTNQRGFHVTYKIPKNSNMPDLPQEFIKVSQSRGLISMTTDKLVSDFNINLMSI